MIATADINQGDCLFTIPREKLLFPDSCGISSLLQAEKSDLESSSGWVPLVLALMHEFTSVCSKWQPYLAVLPEMKDLDQPMFWDEESKLELKGSGIMESVRKDISLMEKEFEEVALPFIKSHIDLFPDCRCRNFEFYKHMVAIVMAYSFTEPQANASSDEDSDSDADEPDTSKYSLPVMVPMADILNHISKNNAHLDFEKESLKMVAVRNIKKGEEIFNTYGDLSNSQLLHMYGFAEKYPENQFDMVEIPMLKLVRVLEEHFSSDIECLQEKFDLLRENDILADEDAIVIDADGIVTEDVMVEIFQVLNMGKGDFTKYKSNKSSLEIESLSLTAADIPHLDPKWKKILKIYSTVKLAHKVYPSSTREEYSSPLFIIHGLFGSKKNWHSLAKHISAFEKTVITVDVRNHGDSPHSDDMDYYSMSADVENLINCMGFSKVNLLGHSMGGKVAMMLSLNQSDLVEKLIIEDVSPCVSDHSSSQAPQYIQAMKRVTFNKYSSILEARRCISKQLADTIQDKTVRNFILTNITEVGDVYNWKFNLFALERHIKNIMGFPELNHSFAGETLFIGGGKSNYIRPEDDSRIKCLFPKAKIVHIKKAGHWVHHDAPRDFLQTVLKFLNEH